MPLSGRKAQENPPSPTLRIRRGHLQSP